MSVTFPRLQPFELDKLIGTPYVLGETDCIWMTLTVLQSLGIDAPPLNPDWYQMPPIRWARDLLAWGNRIDQPVYDGDGLSGAVSSGLLCCMERRPVSYLQGKKRGELVAPDSFQRRLLPYEWSIIQALGVTEQEYREIFQRIAEEQARTVG